MSRLAGFSLALLLSLVAGPARAQDTAPEAADAKGERVLWLEPLGSVLGGVLSVSPDSGGERVFILSGGYAHPLDARRALTTELFVMHQAQGCWGMDGSGCSGDTWLRASVGLAYSHGGRPGLGFLLEPRLILGYFHAQQGLSVQAGLDVGYQYRYGPVYIALVVGLAAGVSTVGAQLPPFLLADPVLTSRNGGPGLRLALGLNLQALRVGFTF